MIQPSLESASQRTDASRTTSQETDALSVHLRLIELEAENLRLQRLVGELLIKNQKLRDMRCENAGSSTSRNLPWSEGLQME